MKKQYDKKVFKFNSDISLGDIVFLRKHYGRRGESKKLNPLYEGMWDVIAIRGPNYLLKNGKTGKEKIMHHNELRRRPPRSYELWQSGKHVRHRGESSKSNVQQHASNNQDKLTVNRTRAECAPQVVYYPVIQEASLGLQIATKAMFTLYRIGFCSVSKVAPVQCEQELMFCCGAEIVPKRSQCEQKPYPLCNLQRSLLI